MIVKTPFQILWMECELQRFSLKKLYLSIIFNNKKGRD